MKLRAKIWSAIVFTGVIAGALSIFPTIDSIIDMFDEAPKNENVSTNNFMRYKISWKSNSSGNIRFVGFDGETCSEVCPQASEAAKKECAIRGFSEESYNFNDGECACKKQNIAVSTFTCLRPMSHN